ncbi:hypothetical protein B0A49_10196, partial [Cryomyces minteri]
RSASLIVAYGLYKNPGMSVQEAYDSVKKRSKWIGPNMNLIMQLQEFRSNLLKSSGNPAANVNGVALPLTMDLNLSGVPNSEIYHQQVTEFKSSPFDRAALLGTLGMGSSSPHHARPPPLIIRRSVRAELGTLDITRSSLLTPSRPAPDALHGPGEGQPRNLEAKDAPPQNHPDHPPSGIAPFTSQSTESDVLMSPRATEFTENPFALPLAIPSETSAAQTPITGDEDPRSPAQKGGSPIIRSIFDVL